MESLSLVARLKELQDLLGDVHDTQVFQRELTAMLDRAAREHPRKVSRELAAAPRPGDESRPLPADPRPGLLELSRRLRRRGMETFARAERQWLHGAAEGFFGDAAELAERLIRHAGRTREIERKYLLRSMPPAAHVAPALEIDQGWLPGNRIAERLRRVRSAGQEARLRTIKAGIGVDRLEIEEELPGALFDQLWPLTEGRRVSKRRHRVSDAALGLTWEVDQFTDRDLVLAEIELDSVDQAVDPPVWLRPYLVREVTGEEEYVNLNLAK